MALPITPLDIVKYGDEFQEDQEDGNSGSSFVVFSGIRDNIMVHKMKSSFIRLLCQCAF